MTYDPQVAALLSIPRDIPRRGGVGTRALLDDFVASPIDEICRYISNEEHRVIREDRWSGKVLSNAVVVGYEVSLGELVSVGGSALVDHAVSLLVADWNKIQTQLTSSHRHSLSAVEDDQLSMRLRGDFFPSKRLTEIWLSSLETLAREAGQSVSAPADFEAAQQLSNTLITLFGTIAQQLRYETPDGLHAITKHNRITANYQIQICDALFIVPDQASEFLGLLKDELTSALRSGVAIEGDWGRLSTDRRGDVFFRLMRPNFVEDPFYEEPEAVE